MKEHQKKSEPIEADWNVGECVVFIKEDYQGLNSDLKDKPKTEIGIVSEITHEYNNNTFGCEWSSWIIRKDLAKCFKTKQEAEDFANTLKSTEVCETCNGEGTVMTAKLYPNGHTEVDEDCPDCNGEGEIEIKKPLVFGKFNIGDIVVSLGENYYRKNGALYKILIDSKVDKLWYSSKYSANKKEWRLATPEEEAFYESGGRNINDMKIKYKHGELLCGIHNGNKWYWIYDANEESEQHGLSFINLTSGWIDNSRGRVDAENIHIATPEDIKELSDKGYTIKSWKFVKKETKQEFESKPKEQFKFNKDDLVIITEMEGFSDWSDWWIELGEIIRLGGKYWKDSELKALNEFRVLSAISKCSPDGNGAWSSSGEKDKFKLRHATKKEIDYYNKVGLGANINDLNNNKQLIPKPIESIVKPIKKFNFISKKPINLFN